MARLFCIWAAGLLSACSGPCEIDSDCDSGEYCVKTDGACLGSGTTGSCESKPDDCPEVAEPVCGCDGNTYSNACEAGRAGVSVATLGACVLSCESSGEDCSSRRYCRFDLGSCGSGPGTCELPPRSCEDAFPNPVCGCDGKTYDSSCDAARAEVSVASTGPCPCGGVEGRGCEEGRFCRLAVGACASTDAVGTCEVRPESCESAANPVCGCDGETYENACLASRARISVQHQGSCVCRENSDCDEGWFCDYGIGACADAAPTGNCRPVPEACGKVSSPVCGCNGRTYENSCLASRAAVSVLASGNCTCDADRPCEEGWYCSMPDGACLRSGGEGSCEPIPESCPAVIAEICGCDGETYDNGCVAAQNGVPVAAAGPCVIPE